MPLKIWWHNFLTSPVQNFTCAELNQTQCDYAGMRECLEMNCGKGLYGTPLPKLKFIQAETFVYIAVNNVNSTNVLCYVIIQIHRCYAKMVQVVFNFLKSFILQNTEV